MKTRTHGLLIHIAPSIGHIVAIFALLMSGLFLSPMDALGQWANGEWAKTLRLPMQEGFTPPMLPTADGGLLVVTAISGNNYDIDPGPGEVSYLTMPENYTADRLVLAKYDQDFTYTWSVASDSIGGSLQSLGATTDATGNIYVYGYYSGMVDLDPGSALVMPDSSNQGQRFLAKYSSTGQYQWHLSWGIDQFESLYLDSAAVDSAGDIIITGTYEGTLDLDPGPGTQTVTSSQLALFFVKISSSGVFQWGRDLKGTGRFSVFTTSVTTDSSNAIYLVGGFVNSIDFDAGAGTVVRNPAYGTTCLVKYNSGGTYQWVRTIVRSGSNGGNKPLGVFINSTGEVVVPGEFNYSMNFNEGGSDIRTSNSNSTDIFVTKVSTANTYSSTFTLSTPGNERYSKVIGDSNGNVYIAAMFYQTVDLNPGAGFEERSPIDGTTSAFFLKLDSSNSYVASFTIPRIDDYQPFALTLTTNARLAVLSKLKTNGYSVLFSQYDFALPADTTPPTSPVITYPPDQWWGTNSTAFVVSGTAEPYSLILLDGTYYSYQIPTIADSLGNWSTSVDATDGGNYTLSAIAVDNAGSYSDATPGISVEVDSEPSWVELNYPEAGSWVGEGIPEFWGDFEDDVVRVRVFLDGLLLGEAEYDESEWYISPSTPLADGLHIISVESLDYFGNINMGVYNRSFYVDLTSPPAPVITTPTAQSNLKTATPVINGTAEANSFVIVYPDYTAEGDLTYSTQTDSLGNWSVTIADVPLLDGPHTVYAQAKDQVGKIGPVSSTVHFFVDATPPPAPIISSPATQSFTKVVRPTVSGTAEALSTVRLFLNGAYALSTTTNGNGSWSLTLNTNLQQGMNLLSAQAIDGSEHVGPFSPTAIVYLDTTAPPRPTISAPANGSTSANATITIKGTSEPSATVTLYRSGSALNDVSASSAGLWSLQTTIPTANAAVLYQAVARDRAGNQSALSSTLSITYSPIDENPDPDRDGLSTKEEANYGTNPLLADTDGDGVNDGQEILDGTNPLDSGSRYTPPQSTVCSDWNGFLGGMTNIMEHINVGTKKTKITSTLYDLSGKARSALTFGLNPGKQFDQIINNANGFSTNQYGRLCSVSNGGQIDGRMVYYKEDSVGGYDFALAMPFTVGVKGSQFVQWGTRQPSRNEQDTDNLVANWVQITNMGTGKQSGVLRFYSASGALIQNRAVSISGNGRVDVSANIKPHSDGLVEWVPTNSNAFFQLRLLRYYYDNPLGTESFAGAIQDNGRTGLGVATIVPFDTRNSSSWLHISNSLNQLVRVDIKIYDSYGYLKKTLQATVKNHATWNIDLGLYAPRQSGVVEIQGDKLSSLIASTTQVKLTSEGSIQTVYLLPSVEPQGLSMFGTYNTFLNQSCTLLLASKAEHSIEASINLTRSDGTVIEKGRTIKIPAHGLKDVSICQWEQANQYGTVGIQLSKTNTISATVVRIGPNEDYRMPTPVRQ